MQALALAAALPEVNAQESGWNGVHEIGEVQDYSVRIRRGFAKES
jgi:hypothetical protein